MHFFRDGTLFLLTFSVRRFWQSASLHSFESLPHLSSGKQLIMSSSPVSPSTPSPSPSSSPDGGENGAPGCHRPDTPATKCLPTAPPARLVFCRRSLFPNALSPGVSLHRTSRASRRRVLRPRRCVRNGFACEGSKGLNEGRRAPRAPFTRGRPPPLARRIRRSLAPLRLPRRRQRRRRWPPP